MANGEIEQKATLSREELARWLADLAALIDRGGTAEIGLSEPAVSVTLPDRFRCELEIEQEGDELELEIELKGIASGP